MLYIKSYIKDNIDFPSKCSRANNENTIIANYGHQTIEYWVNNNTQLLGSRFSKEFVLDSTKFILENNNFGFDNGFYN